MPTAIWNGVISFGLLNIPVSLQSGSRSTDLHFRMLDSRDNNPIRFERVNAETGEEVPWKQIVKAFEYDKGNYVVLDKADFKAAAPDSLETVEIESFVERNAINPMYHEKPYYLVPGRKADKGYVLLREVLRRTERIGIGRVVIRTREYLCAVMPIEDALVMILLRFPQEIVPADTFKLPGRSLSDHRISSREVTMAEQLVESMTVEFDPGAYIDDFRARLHEVIDARIRAQEGTVTSAEAEEEEDEKPTTNVVDFMALRRQSLAGKGGKAGAAGKAGDERKAVKSSKSGASDAKPARSGGARKAGAGGTKSGAKSGAKSATKSGTKSRTNSGTKSGSKTPSKSASRSPSKPAPKRPAQKKKAA